MPPGCYFWTATFMHVNALCEWISKVTIGHTWVSPGVSQVTPGSHLGDARHPLSASWAFLRPLWCKVSVWSLD